MKIMSLSIASAVISYFTWKSTNNVLSPLVLSNFHQVKTVSNDTWNKYENGEVCLSYYKKESDVPVVDPTKDLYYRYDKIKYNGIGYIQYRKNVGQIGLIRLDEEFRGRSLGKQMLEKAIVDMKENDVKEIWAVTSENHSFWSNVYNGSFTWRDPAHRSVSGSGYYMKI